MSVIFDRNRSRSLLEEPDERPRRGFPVTTLLVVLALLVGGGIGYLIASRDASGPTPFEPYLDAEWDYLGAIATWPAEPGSTADDPFSDNYTTADLVGAGRTACTRAGDDGMTFDGMLDLLQMNPHQTYVVMAEAADKLCPSAASDINAHLD